MSAWIESHQTLERHPKTAGLMILMGWDIDTTIGKLHRFWWWCMDFAPDGDLTRFNDTQIAIAAGVAAPDAKPFVEAMVSCGGEAASGFIDRLPYFRVHDWWEYVGRLLQLRYKNQPDKWQAIKEKCMRRAEELPNNVLSTFNRTPPNQPTNQTNRTHQPTKDSLPLRGFVRPTLDSVLLIFAKAGMPEREAEKFFNYYDSNGWKVGKNPMKSLNGAVANWKLRWQENTPKKGPESNQRHENINPPDL